MLTHAFQVVAYLDIHKAPVGWLCQHNLFIELWIGYLIKACALLLAV